MSAIEAVIEKVRHLDEPAAMRLLAWIGAQANPVVPSAKPRGAMAMLGFARKFHDKPKTTAEWIAELRAGDEN